MTWRKNPFVQTKAFSSAAGLEIVYRLYDFLLPLSTLLFMSTLAVGLHCSVVYSHFNSWLI